MNLTLKHALPSLSGLFTIVLWVTGFALPAQTASSQVILPIRVITWNAEPVSETVQLPVSGASRVQSLYLRIHGIRFGGQVSVQVNGGEWYDLGNKSVRVADHDKRHGGIGGIHATIGMDLDLPSGSIREGLNEISIRLNGTDGISTAIRVIELNVRDAAGRALVPPTQFTQNSYFTANDLPKIHYNEGERVLKLDEAMAEGRRLWKQKNSLIHDPISKTPIRASCSSCHFEDGSDLNYKNFSNATIIARSRFHGLSHREGQYISLYVRRASTQITSRPWNPPFQPGPNIDPELTDSAEEQRRKANKWFAGAGLQAVAVDPSQTIAALFPGGVTNAVVAERMDHQNVLSMREIPVPFQMPDWNMWLPRIAPDDLWEQDYLLGEELHADAVARLGIPGIENLPLREVPYRFLEILENKINTPQKRQTLIANGELYKAFETFHDQFLGSFMSSGTNQFNRLNASEWDDNVPNIAAVRAPGIDRARMATDLLRWAALKTLEMTRKYNLESAMDAKEAFNDYDAQGIVTRVKKGNQPRYTPEALSIPGGGRLSTVYGLAPHITAKNNSFFNGQDELHGKLESNQWYMLQTVLYAGHSGRVLDNVPLDWAYTKNHLLDAQDQTGVNYAPLRAAFQIKMLQSQRTGRGVIHGGFDQRTLAPNFFYSNQRLNQDYYKGGLNAIEPELWEKLFEEFLHEWLYILESYDLATMQRDGDVESVRDRHRIEKEGRVPVGFREELGISKHSYVKNFFDLPSEVLSDALYRMIPKLHDEGISEALLLDLIAWCKRAWPDHTAAWAGQPKWESLFSRKALVLENFEGGTRFTNLGNTTYRIKDGNSRNRGQYITFAGFDPFLTKNDFLRGGGGHTIAVQEIGQSGTSRREGHLRDLNRSLDGAQRLTLSARAGAFQRENNAIIGRVEHTIVVRFNGGREVRTNLGDLNSNLYNQKFETISADIVVPAGATQIQSVTIERTRYNGTGRAFLCLDNFMIEGSQSRDTTPPRVPLIDLETENDADRNARYLAIEFFLSDSIHNARTWSMPADLAGYNVYRWEEGQNQGDAIKLNYGPATPYYNYEDRTVQGGKLYYYQVTSVDKEGNESARSRTVSRRVPDSYDPNPVKKLWYNIQENALRVHWFGVPDLDIEHYEVFRRTPLQAQFQNVGTVRVAYGGLFFDDYSAQEGKEYEYYVRAVDSSGRYSNSVIMSIGLHDNSRPALWYNTYADKSVERNGSALGQWRNLVDQTQFPGRPVFETPNYPSTSRSQSGLTGIDLKASRSGLTLLSSSQQGEFLDFRSGGTATSKAGFSAFVAFKVDSITQNINPVLVNHGNPGEPRSFGLRYDNNGVMECFLGGVTHQKSAEQTLSDGDTVVLAMKYDAVLGQIEFWDSKNKSTLVAPVPAQANLASTQSMYLGASGNSSQWMNGMVTEVVFFKNPLKKERFEAECDRLVTRWISKRVVIPATIEAEDFDLNIPGQDIMDTTLNNIPGHYRSSPADIGVSPGGGFHISYTAAQEFLRYQLTVPRDGEYRVKLRVASEHNTEKRIRVEMGGVSKEISFNTRGAGWQDYQDVVFPDSFSLVAGNADLKVVFLTGGINLEFIVIEDPRFPSEGDAWSEGESYQAWLDRWNEHIGKPEEDRDGDGISNFLEYAMGTDPLDGQAAANAGFQYRIEGENVTFEYELRKRDANLQYGVETSRTLQGHDWLQNDPEVQVNHSSGDNNFEKIQYVMPRTHRKKFMRLYFEPYPED